MRFCHLQSICEAYSNLNEELLLKYLDYFKISIKKSELKDLQIFLNFISASSENKSIYENYYVWYEIPQIGKEFDLLKFWNNYNINIELKRCGSEKKIKDQLIRNKYYLGFLDKETFCFSFISEEEKVYKLDTNNELIEVDLTELINILEGQELKEIQNIDDIFNPSNYLVSPFNSTEEFIRNQYFLTSQQEEIKEKTIIEIRTSKSSFISIVGNAWTGKTLLTYDIAKDSIGNKKKTLVIHCWILNLGQERLRDTYNWDIVAIKDFRDKDISLYSLIIIDEVQRIYPGQLKHIISEIKQYEKTCIFWYDKKQCLSWREINNDIEKLIETYVVPIKFQLTKKIRSNKEVASFIKCLFEAHKEIDKIDMSNIKLNYFKTYSEAKAYIKTLKERDWKVINYTPSNRQSLPYDNFKIHYEESTHNVIGQEFDNVIGVVDSHFYYDENKKLSTKNYKIEPYYHPTKMLLQILTRTRRKLNFIVIDNEEIMIRCLEILTANSAQK